MKEREAPLMYTVERNGKYVVPLAGSTLLILVAMGIFVVAATLSAWVFYALFGDWGIILWKITGFLTVGLYFTFVRPYRKARRGD